MSCARESGNHPGDFVPCLVGGSAEDQARGRKSTRRALLISLAVESAALGALVILPLLAAPAELLVHSMIPIPPYRASRPARTAASPPPKQSALSAVCLRPSPAPVIPALKNDQPADGAADVQPAIEGGQAAVPSLPAGISDARPGPVRPAEPRRQTRVREASIDPALLVHRVEPVFPPLARQIRRSGKVELHAIISTDGRVLSLEVVGGDPLFVASALEAVRQWRYKPTYLDGQPVEIDTFITVIYTLEPQ